MPKILTPSGIKKLEDLKATLEAITLKDPDEITSKTLFHAKKLVEWGLINNSITGFLSKTAKEHLSEVLNSKDCNAIEVFNDTTRSIALTLISSKNI